jgi:hypothetical protein
VQSIDLQKAPKNRKIFYAKNGSRLRRRAGSSLNDVPGGSFKPLEPEAPLEWWRFSKMKSKIVILTLAVLFCLTAQLYALSNIASGAGCGTNPLGDTSGDTDFYVSKNQKAPTSDASLASGSGKQAVALGSTATPKATIQSLNPDKTSSQVPGATVVWKVEATSPNNEKILYNFLLNGPATGGKLLDETGWIADNSWTWNTTKADAGENQIVARVMRNGASGFDAELTQSFIVSATAQDSETAAVDTTPVAPAQDPVSAEDASNTVSNTAATGADSHPVSKTADSKSNKPRVAPDEKSRQLTTSSGGLKPGPNMSMPDPSPKSTSQPSSDTTTDSQTQTGSASDQSSTMAVEGKWTVKLANAGSSVDLFLVQTGGSIVGYGNLNEQDTKIPLTFKGTVSADSMSIEAQTVVDKYVNKIDKSINLDLVKVDRVITGSYEIYSGKDLTGSGNATASRFSA